MKASATAIRYARALADVVLAQGVEGGAAEVLGQLRRFQALLEESSDLRHVMSSPAVSRAHKGAVVLRLREPLGLSPATVNFLRVLADHRRLAGLGEILTALQGEIDQRLGVLRVNLTSARELTAEQRQSIEQSLGAATGKRVSLDAAVDPGLIAGATARIGSIVFDGSVHGRLAALGHKLREV